MHLFGGHSLRISHALLASQHTDAWPDWENAAAPWDHRTCLFIAMLSTVIHFFLNVIALTISVDPNNHPKEDSVLGVTDEKRDKFKEAIAGEDSKIFRWFRVATNQQENFPMALTVMWGAVLVGANDAILMISFLGHTVFRFCFMVFYLNGIQPWRSLSYMGGQLCVMLAGSAGLFAVFPGRS